MLTGFGAHAQMMDVTMYHMKDLPLNNQLNPAFQPKNGSTYMALPFIPFLAPTSIGISVTGDNINFGNLFGDKPDYKSIITSSDKYGIGQVSFEYSPISFGFMIKDMYFTFDVKTKITTDGRVTKDLEELIWYGNGDPLTIGRNLDMDGFGATGTAYAEVALGFSKEVIKNQLFLGGKIKYLQGGAFAQATMGDDSYIYTDEDTYAITVGFNPDIYLAGLPVDVPFGTPISLDSLTKFGKYNFKTDSRGVGFDLGGSWDIPWVKGLNVSASVINVGFIDWSGVKAVAAHPNDPIVFDGFDVKDGKEFFDELIDSLKMKAEVIATSGSHRKWLYPTAYAGINYEIGRYFNVGGLFGYQFGKYENLPMFAVSANTQNFMVNASASFSYFNNRPNVGLGLLFGRRGCQFHLIVDNMLAINYKTAQQTNIRMGMNMLWGENREARKGPMVATAMPATSE